MDTRKTLLAAVTLFWTSSAAAQIAGGQGSFQGILPLISGILGIDMGNPYNVLGIAATFGILTIANYIILKVAFKKLDLMDLVLPSGGRNGGGRNILLVLSLLMTLSIVGSGAFMGIINGFRSIILLMFTFMLLGGLAFVISGGTGGIVGGTSYITGKSSKAAAEGIEEGAEGLRKANDILSDVKPEIKDGAESGSEEEEEDAADRIEEAIEIMNRVIRKAGRGLERDEEELQDAINEVKQSLNIDEDERQKLGMIEGRIERAGTFLQNSYSILDSVGAQGTDFWAGDNDYASISTDKIRSLDIGMKGHKAKYSGGNEDFYGLASVKEDLEEVNNSLDLMMNELDEEEHEAAKAFSELEDVASDVLGYYKLLKEVQELLNEAENDDELLEELAQKEQWEQLYHKADEEENQEKQLENRLDKVENLEKSIKEELENALELLKEHKQIDDSLVREIESKLEPEEDTLEDLLNNLEQKFEETDHGLHKSIREKYLEDGFKPVSELLSSLESKTEKIDGEEVEEDEKEVEVISDIEEALSSA